MPRDKHNKGESGSLSAFPFYVTSSCYCFVPVKFWPVISALFMFSVMLAGENVYLLLLGEIVYVPLTSPVKL
jgi:hypothetical protein